MKTAIITAFEPFGNDTKNPTEAILERIPETLYDIKIIKLTLPVIYNHAFERLLPLIDEHDPVMVLSLGLAKGRTHVEIERIAINKNDARSKDNLGNIKYEEPIEPSGPDGIFTTLPLKSLRERFQKTRMPVSVSNSAGTYVCNNLFYRTLHYTQTFNMDTVVGFVHVPATPDMVSAQPGVPSMEKSVMVESVMTIIDTVLNPVDFKEHAQKVDKGKKVK